ncbi:MAG TPA: M56 family metallopeptidase, partial [Gemmataceae bacterium]|nr:M56 family metallopeptidase [Gemmataceae bacterium]
MNAFVDNTIEPLMLQLGEWSVRWAVLIVLIAGWIVMARPKNARLRYGLCLAGLVLGLFLPVLPRWGRGIADSPTVETVAPTQHVVTAPPSAALTIPDPEREVEAAAAPIAPIQPREVPETVAAHRPVGISRLALLGLAGAWLAGVTYGLLRWLTGVWYLNRLRWTACAIGGPCATLFAACLRESGLTRRVSIRVHLGVDSPVALGPWRPTVLVPVCWFDQPEPLVRASMLHELAHLSRRDDWLAILFQSVRCLMFFHPGVRWLLARLECEREIICDEIALAHDVDAQSYASLLLQLAGRPGRLLPPALPFGRRRTIKARIDHILESPMKKSYWSTVAARVVGMVVLACALTAGGWTWRTPEEVEPGVLTVDSGESAGQEKPNVPSKPKVPKEELRYGGKSFADWTHTLEVDLSPDVRKKAFEALCVLGLHGYGKEAAKVILNSGREYDVYSAIKEDNETARSASYALGRLGEIAIPELLDELKTGNAFGRRLAAFTLRWGTQGGTWQQNGGSLDFIRSSFPKSLLTASPRNKEIVDILLAATSSKDTALRFDVIAILAAMGPQARIAVPRLIELFSDPDPMTKTAALEAVTRIGGEPKIVIPGLEKLIAEETV